MHRKSGEYSLKLRGDVETKLAASSKTAQYSSLLIFFVQSGAMLSRI